MGCLSGRLECIVRRHEFQHRRVFCSTLSAGVLDCVQAVAKGSPEAVVYGMVSEGGSTKADIEALAGAMAKVALSTPNNKHSTLNTKPWTRNPKPETLNPEPETLSPRP